MKKMFVKIRDLAEEKLRGACAGLSPEKRVMTIVMLTVLFALGNFYMIFRAIYDIGREDVKREVIEITPLDIPDFIPADTLTDSKSARWKSFLTSSTKKTMSNDANKLRQRQEIRKYLVFAGMFLLFVGCMWLIFAPSKEERQREEKNAGFNSELPTREGQVSRRTRLPPTSRRT